VGRRKIGFTAVSGVDALIAELGRRRHWVLGLSELRAEGVSDKAIRTRLNDGRLRRLHRGVFAVGPGPVSQRGWWRAAGLAGGPASYVSHLHAGAVRDLVKAPHGPVHVTVDGWRQSRKGIHFHSASLAAVEIDEVDAIPVTSLARTFLDVAATEEELTLRRTYERAERLQVLDLTPIREVLLLRAGHRGAARLSRPPRLRPDRCSGCAPGARAALPGPPPAGWHPRAAGQRAGRGLPRRLLLARVHLVVELDSYEFHGDREAFERDRAKIADLRAPGHQAVQFTYRQVTADPEWVVARTRALMVRDAASPAAL
jgi:putative AbiEi antitoxin of type IV toxin-antitoxin system